jgi:sarcosine oxidase subunit beta
LTPARWDRGAVEGPGMADTADVVIIGGGVTGCSIAFHLAERGVRDVVLLEKRFLASGATGRSSACIRQHYSTPETCRMVLHSLRFFETFAERTGGRTASFVRVGYLLGVDDRLRKPMEASVALQQAVGIRTSLVSPEEMREIEPRVRVDDFVAGCHEPDAGYADPSQTTQALAGAARERGARILEQVEVVGIGTAGGRVTGVRTTRGEIQAPVVVNAAGTWADRVGRLVGVNVPITVCRHKISFLARPEAARSPHPLVYDFVRNLYSRPETGGLTLIGPLDAEELADRADPDSYREGLTFEETADAMERAMHRFPVLEHGEVARGYAGCFDVTPDWHPILDRSPVDGFYVAAGFSGHGFKLSPAVGDMVARLVVEGPRPGDDVLAFQLSRFAEGKPIRGTYGDWLMC